MKTNKPATFVEAVLRDVKDDQLSLAVIARRHGVSSPTVWRWSNNAGVKRRLGAKRLLPSKGWRQDYEAGMTLMALAAKYRVSIQTIQAWQRDAGLKSRPRGARQLAKPSAWHQEILELVKTHTYAEVGRRMGIPRQTVCWVVKRWHGTEASCERCRGNKK